MIPKEAGYYWLRPTHTSSWQAVHVIRGEDVLHAVLPDRSNSARWGRERLSPPGPDLVMICGVDCQPGDVGY